MSHRNQQKNWTSRPAEAKHAFSLGYDGSLILSLENDRTPGGEPRVSVRAMILSLARFKIAESQHTKVLERQWAVYREKNHLDLYGKAIASESRGNDFAHSNVR